MFSTVLIPTDLSPASDDVLRRAGSLARLGTRSFVLLHVLGIRHLGEMAPALAAYVEPRLAAQRRALEESGLPVEVVIAPGTARDEIGRVAKSRSASLVLLAPPGGTLLSELRVGSVTLDALHGIELPLLHVQEEGSPHGHSGPVLDGGDDIDRERLERLARAARAAGASYVHVEVAHGSPAREILIRAAEIADCLVVMGAQGRGFVPEMLLGSVSHAVARQTAASVLLVPHLVMEAPLRDGYSQ